jgi:hypothetical protein
MLAMTFAMDCASGAPAERLDRILREAEETLLGDAVDFPQPYICRSLLGARPVGHPRAVHQRNSGWAHASLECG